MDTALPQKFPFILDRNLAKASCTENRVCASCDTVALNESIKFPLDVIKRKTKFRKYFKIMPLLEFDKIICQFFFTSDTFDILCLVYWPNILC